MYSLLTGGHRDAPSTRTAQTRRAQMGILQTAATTSVAFIVHIFFKFTNEILNSTGLLLGMKYLSHVLINLGMNVWSLMLNFALCHLWGIIERVVLIFLNIELLMDNEHIRYVSWGKMTQFQCI